MEDYYAILGVPPDADEQQIRSAYRNRVKQYHPDINQDPFAQTIFIKIQEAYEILSDPEKRKNYDHEFGNIDRNASYQQKKQSDEHSNKGPQSDQKKQSQDNFNKEPQSKSTRKKGKKTNFIKYIGIAFLFVILISAIGIVSWIPATQQGPAVTQQPSSQVLTPKTDTSAFKSDSIATTSPFVGCLIVGKWTRTDGVIYTVFADGRVEAFDSRIPDQLHTAHWSQTGPNDFTWYWTNAPKPGQANYIDSMSFSSDCDHLLGVNNYGETLKCIRSQSPVATSSAMAMNNGGCSMLGKWKSPDGGIYTVKRSNSVEFYDPKSPGDIKYGQWAQPDEKKIIWYWNNGPGNGQRNYVDTMDITQDCQNLNGKNNYGYKITCIRI